MKRFKFSKNPAGKKQIQTQDQPLMQLLESRQLMSVAVPGFFAHPDLPNPHSAAFSFDSAMPADAGPGPAFGQVGNGNFNGSGPDANAFNLPLGLIGANLVSLQSPPAAFGSARADAAVPAMVPFSSGISPDVSPGTSTPDTMTPTPGSGLTFLALQAARTSSQPVLDSRPVIHALTDLGDMASASALSASSNFHARASAIAQKLEGVISMLGYLNMAGKFETIPSQLPSISALPDTPIDSSSPATGAEMHSFADGASGIEAIAKNVGEAFLQSLVIDLAHFESALPGDSMVAQLGRSLTDWRAAAVAGAVIALGTYVQRDSEQSERKVNDSWLVNPLRGS
jgi:hypothetical protein